MSGSPSPRAGRGSGVRGRPAVVSREKSRDDPRFGHRRRIGFAPEIRTYVWKVRATVDSQGHPAPGRADPESRAPASSGRRTLADGPRSRAEAAPGYRP